MTTGEPSRGRLWSWFDDRLGLAGFERLARKKEVPVHKHTFWYYLGGMTLFLFIVQVGTGILLLFYYRASASEAYESIQFIMTEVKFGWLIRSLHHWAANLMIFALFLHMFSVLILRAYRPPRELTWLTGAGLLVVTLAFGFTGYLLPWNQLAYFATRVGTQIVGVVPFVGEGLLRIARGGDDVSGATLTRFYALHAAVLPTLIVFLLATHVYLVQKLGMSTPPSIEKAGTTKRPLAFMPNFLLRDLVGWLGALAIIAALAAYFPAELGEKADPFAPAPAGIKPEWYFMFMFQTLKYLPAHILGIEGEIIGVMGFGLAALVLVFVPFIDRRRDGEESHRFFGYLNYVWFAAIAFILIMTYLGYTEVVPDLTTVPAP
jgi:cytochrome b6